MKNLDGKVALVTGGGRGIGRATALELARRGADVAVVARSAGEISEVAAAVVGLGRRAYAHAADISDSTAVAAVVPAVERALGPISMLVNNAGEVGPFGLSWELDPAEWEKVLRINLVAPYLLTRAALPQMLAAGWGRIVNVSSGAAKSPFPRTGPYSVSKAGVDMLTRQVGSELSGATVVVTAIYPGIVDTAMPASIRAQQAAAIGQETLTRFHDLHDKGAMQAPERPARFIVAVIEANDPALQGRILEIGSPEGQKLLESYTG
jgi:NAD(P)-dependent dehydrogenase (short-subunit alcohol dehydrogenase family)